MAGEPAGLIRVLLVDTNAASATRLRVVLEHEPDLCVVGEATAAEAALSLLKAHRPEMVLIDLGHDQDQGLALLPRLLAAQPSLHALVLTGLGDTELNRRAVRAGALGVILRETALESVAKAVRRVNAGEVWLERALIASVLRELAHQQRQAALVAPHPSTAGLTSREREVIMQVSIGLKNHQIAERLSISEATVRHHLTSIFSKLHVTDRLELVVYAFRTGLAKLHFHEG